MGDLGGVQLPPLCWLSVSPHWLPVLTCVCQWCCRENPQVPQGSSRSPWSNRQISKWCRDSEGG